MDEQDYTKYLPLAFAAILVSLVLTLVLRRKRKPRNFRDDPIGALKDHSEIVASKAQEATEDALMRLQETIDEIRDRMPEVNRKRMVKRRKELNGRLADLTGQAQDLLKELRSSSIFSR
jgi:hypothetical protein